MSPTSFRLTRILLSSALAVILAASAAACALQSTPSPALEPVTLKFVYLRYSADYEPLAEEYHRLHPNITIELDPMPVVAQALARNLVPESKDADAIRIPVSNVPTDLLDSFLPLDSLISTSKDFPLNGLLPGSLEALRLGGKQVGIPAGVAPFVIFYSPKKFQVLGVQPPLPDWDLEDFLEIARAANNPDPNGIGSPKYSYGFCSSPQFIDPMLFSYLFGGALFDNLISPTRATLDQLENAEALAWYASLRNDLGVIPERNDGGALYNLMTTASCGLWIDSIDSAGWGSSVPGDAVPLPMPKGKTAFNIAIADGYYILAKSAHPQEAFDWIRFLMEHQVASGKLIPPLKSQVESKEYAARVSKAVVTVARSLEENSYVFTMELNNDARYSQIFPIFNEAATRTFSKEVTAKRALQEAQVKADAVYK